MRAAFYFRKLSAQVLHELSHIDVHTRFETLAVADASLRDFEPGL